MTASIFVADAVARQFGLEGHYTPLISERDQNFRMTTTDNDSYVVKVTSLAEDRTATDFQIAALNHLANLGIAGVPRNVLTTSGKFRGAIDTKNNTSLCLRVLTWVEGTLLDDSELTPGIAHTLGQRLADLDKALESFSGEGDGQVSLWDTQRAGRLRSLLVHINDSTVRQQVEAVLDDFDKRVIPALKTFPRQAIHNDANTENILLDTRGEVSGIIDFGDLLLAPRIVELSTAAAYQRSGSTEPLQFITPLVAGYQQRNPLSESELDVLFDLIRTRLAMTITLFYWRLADRGKDDPYLRKQIDSEAGAFAFLQRLSHVGRTRFRERISK